MATRLTGIERAQEVLQDRPRRVKELKRDGKKITGYICLYPVIEMITAADSVPYRIFGDLREPITKADSHMATVVCSFMRSCLDIGLKGQYDFLDGVVFAHVCDVTCMIPGIWRQTIPTKYTHFIDTPHTLHPSSQAYFRTLLDDFRITLEDYTGGNLTTERLKKAIQLHNNQRALVRELYDMKKPDPPLISGVETLIVLKAIMSLPVEEGNDLLREVIQEVKTRRNALTKKKARLLVWGSILDDTAFIDMVENLDAHVVIDDTCVGSRAYFSDIPVTKDPLDGLAQYYLAGIKCPRTVKEAERGSKKKDYKADLEVRFGYLKDYARDWNINGVILQSLRYCDGHGYEVPGLKDYFEDLGLPSMYLEHDYSEAALAPLRTRVQGLTEIIS
jgi:benzoyl-CoA reductase subunit C